MMNERQENCLSLMKALAWQEANDIDGFAVDLSKFTGRVSLVVNVASE